MLKVTLGIPVVDSVPGESFHHLMRLAVMTSRHASIHVSECVGVLPHDRARNQIVEEAKRLECDLLFFVDDDTIPPYDCFAELYKTLVDNSASVVSGHYYRRGNPYSCVWSKIIDGEYHVVDAAEGIHPIDFSGLGCALIDFKWMMKNLTPPYFTMGMDLQGTVVTDDTTFYEKVRLAGGLILGHAGIRCVHMGGRQSICDETVKFLRQQHILLGEMKKDKGDQDGSRSEFGVPATLTGLGEDIESFGGASAGCRDGEAGILQSRSSRE